MVVCVCKKESNVRLTLVTFSAYEIVLNLFLTPFCLYKLSQSKIFLKQELTIIVIFCIRLLMVGSVGKKPNAHIIFYYIYLYRCTLIHPNPIKLFILTIASKLSTVPFYLYKSSLSNIFCKWESNVILIFCIRLLIVLY